MTTRKSFVKNLNLKVVHSIKTNRYFNAPQRCKKIFPIKLLNFRNNKEKRSSSPISNIRKPLTDFRELRDKFK